MPSYVSNKGVWTPAKEETYVDYGSSKLKQNKGKKSYAYSGPDRAAVEQLKEAGLDSLGESAERNSDNIMRARQMNMTIEEFLKLNEPLTPRQVEAEEAKKNLVVDHVAPKPKKGVQPQGGGVTMSGSLSDDMPV